MRAFTLGLTLLVAACAVGPNYKAPVTAAPKEWSAAKHSDVITTDPLAEARLARWWTLFNDDELNRLVTRAVAQNLDVKAAGLKVSEARALLAYVRAGYFPSVSAGIDADRQRLSSADSYPPYGGVFNSFQAGFDTSWELDIFGQTRREVEATKASLQQEQDDRNGTLVTLLGDLGSDYASLRATQERLRIAERNIAIEQQILDFTQQRSEHGLASDLDVAEAQAQLDTLQSGVPDLRTTIAQEEYSIAELLGEQPDALEDELAESSGILLEPPSLPAEIPSDVIRNRPDIRAAERQLAAGTAAIGIAEAEYFPKFSIDPSIDINAGWLHKLLGLGALAWSLPVSAQVPIFDSGKIAAEVSLTKTLAAVDLVTYQKTVLTAFREVETALSAYQADKSKLDSLRAAADADQAALNRAEDLYKNGIGDFIAVLQDERELYVAQDSIAEAELSMSIQTIALYKALGCGWQSIPAQDLGKADGTH